MKRILVLLCTIVLVNSLAGQDFEKIFEKQIPNALKMKLKKQGISADSMHNWISRDARLGEDVIYYLANFVDKMARNYGYKKKIQANDLLRYYEKERSKASNQFISQIIALVKTADISESDKQIILSRISSYIIPLRADSIKPYKDLDSDINKKYFYRWKLYSQNSGATYDFNTPYKQKAIRAKRKMTEKVKKLLLGRGFEEIVLNNKEFSLIMNYWYLVDTNNVGFGLERGLPHVTWDRPRTGGSMEQFSIGVSSTIIQQANLKVILPVESKQLESNTALMTPKIEVSYERIRFLKNKHGFLSYVSIAPFVSVGFFNLLGNARKEETNHLTGDIFETIKLDKADITVKKCYTLGLRFEFPVLYFNQSSPVMLGISGGQETSEYIIHNKVKYVKWNGTQSSVDEILLQYETYDAESTLKTRNLILNPYFRLQFRKKSVNPSILVGLKQISVLISF